MLYTTGGNALLWGTTRTLLPASLGPILFYCIVISFTHNSLIPMAELSELLSSCCIRQCEPIFQFSVEAHFQFQTIISLFP